MLLIVDLSDLNLKFHSTDIRVNDDDFTLNSLLDKICDGIEEFGQTKLSNRNDLILYHDGKMLNSTQTINTLALNDWDTLYLARRK